MKYVVIERLNFFNILGLVNFDIRKHGSLWCEGMLSSDDLKILDDNGYWYKVLA